MTDQHSPIEATTGEDAGQAIAVLTNAIPIVGGVVSGIVTTVIQKRQNRRLTEFILELADDLEWFNSRLNEEFLRKEEFKDLVEDTFAKAADTRQKEKLECLRNVFLNTIVSDEASFDKAVEWLDLVDRMYPRHIIMLRILADPLAADEQAGNPVGNGGGISTSIIQILEKLLPDWTVERLERTWNELHGMGIHNITGVSVMMTDNGIHQLKNRLTNYGMKSVKYFSKPD